MPVQNRDTQKKTVSSSFRESWSCSFSTDSQLEGEEERSSSAVGLRRKRNSSRTVLYPETIQSFQENINSLREAGNYGIETVTKQLACETFDFAYSNSSGRKKTVFGNTDSLEKHEDFQKLYNSRSASGSLPSECVEKELRGPNSSSVFYSTQSSNGNSFSQTSRVITDSSEYIADTEETSVQYISLSKIPRRSVLLSADSGVPPKRRRESLRKTTKNCAECPSTVATTKSYSSLSRNGVIYSNSYDTCTQEPTAYSRGSQADGCTLVSNIGTMNHELQESLSITACFPFSTQTDANCAHQVEELSPTPSEELASTQNSHLEQTEDDTCGSVSSVQSTEGLTTELYSPYEKFTESSIVQNDVVDDSSDVYDELAYLVQSCEVTEPKNKSYGFLPYIWFDWRRRDCQLICIPVERFRDDEALTFRMENGYRDRILVTEKLSDEGVTILEKKFSVDLKYGLSPEELLKEIPQYDALIVRSATKVNRELILAGSKLRVIGRAGVGVDNIDLHTATERGILVVNAPTGNCVAAAEHTIAHICALSRFLATADAGLKQGKWDRNAYVGTSLEGKWLGVIGLGRIGREVSRRAKGLGMKVLAFDPYTSEESAKSIGVVLEPLENVFSKCDFVTLHVPLIESTRNMVDRELLSKMKPGARLLNIARGGLIDEEALLEFLNNGRLAGAGIDCFVTEPPSKVPDCSSEKLAKHPKVLATPHLGASTVEAQLDVAIEISEAVTAALCGELVPTLVNAPAVSSDALVYVKPRALLAERLGRLAYSLAGGTFSGDVIIHFYSNGDDGEARLIRTGVIKGLMEPGSDRVINVVNADMVSKAHGLQITEVKRSSIGDENCIMLQMKGSPDMEGRIIGNKPHVTRIGEFVVDLVLEGLVLAYYQVDRPGQIGKVGSILGEANVNISFMTLGRHLPSRKALVLLGLDNQPDTKTLERIRMDVGLDKKPVLLDLGSIPE